MSFGVYVHIPYCLQRCPYCDFSTYVWGETLGPEPYLDLLLKEIRIRQPRIAQRTLDTVYFGGGTPSLVEPSFLHQILLELRKQGFQLRPDAEITIEINPGTISREKLENYLKIGVSRFSVGAQSFNDRLLKIAGRKHSADDTRATLKLLREYRLNYSFDLLFALPTQTQDELNDDLREVAEFRPPHVSAYCLTVPESNPMSVGRPPEQEQRDMFLSIERALAQVNILRYELSNFATPGFESRHNLLYWNDEPYWGIGISSHSFLKDTEWGVRFWNPVRMPAYQKQIETELACSPQRPYSTLPPAQVEFLKVHEAMTDYCHTSLRKQSGLSEARFVDKFGALAMEHVRPRLEKLVHSGLLKVTAHGWQFAYEGWVIADRVFEELTFLPEDLVTAPRRN